MSLPYPSVRCVTDVLCSWLSSQLSNLMLDMGMECVEPPDIFIGSSLQSELTTNCMYRMFCQYVEVLCQKSEKYFKDVVDYCKAPAHGRGVETEVYAPAAHGGKHAKLSKQTLLSSRKNEPVSYTHLTLPTIYSV